VNLDRVTITGADDSIDPKDLIALAHAHHYVEWGILVSAKHSGSPRFPTNNWVWALAEANAQQYIGQRLKLALHVCGRWTRQLLNGQNDLLREWAPAHLVGGPGHIFQRMQLNFHRELQTPAVDAAASFFTQRFQGQQIIVQMDGTANEQILPELKLRGVNAVPLFDLSGGDGIVPQEWPLPIYGVGYHGYAGGLGPENLERELERIGQASEAARIWVDMETKVRSNGDKQFDLDKVRRCLEICAPHVVKA
jgi:hypothetical protein